MILETTPVKGTDIKMARLFTSIDYPADVEDALKPACVEHQNARIKILGQNSLAWSTRLRPESAASRLEDLVPCACPNKVFENSDIVLAIEGVIANHADKLAI